MDDRNSVINNSFKNDLDSFIDKAKKNRNKFKDRKNIQNLSSIIKSSHKSYNVDLESLTPNAKLS